MDPVTPPRAPPTTRSITAAQCRAARALSNWSIGRLSREAEIPVSDIVALESGRLLIRAAIHGPLIRAFHRGGVLFLPGEGLRLARESGDPSAGTAAEELSGGPGGQPA